jgi:hypothetical protein
MEKDELLFNIQIITNYKNISRIKKHYDNADTLGKIKRLCAVGMKLSTACKCSRKFSWKQINFLAHSMCSKDFRDLSKSYSKLIGK